MKIHIMSLLLLWWRSALYVITIVVMKIHIICHYYCDEDPHYMSLLLLWWRSILYVIIIVVMRKMICIRHYEISYVWGEICFTLWDKINPKVMNILDTWYYPWIGERLGRHAEFSWWKRLENADSGGQEGNGRMNPTEKGCYDGIWIIGQDCDQWRSFGIRGVKNLDSATRVLVQTLTFSFTLRPL